jgi:hypothetical protein
MAKKPKNPARLSRTKVSEDIPPGATRKALDRPLNPGGGPPASGAGPRHAAGDPGSEVESTGSTDTNQTIGSPPVEEEDPLEQGPPYSGISGGAVGGTPAEGRSSGGRTGRGIAPGTHRGDSTIGADPHGPAKE